MFEETKRAIQQFDETTSISVPVSYDEVGYFDRECSSEECQFQFKVLMEDWKAEVRDEEVSCPFCDRRRDVQNLDNRHHQVTDTNEEVLNH